MAPLAPGLFSTTMLRGMCVRAASAKARATPSVPPPGWNGTISSICRLGKSAATAGPPNNASAAIAAAPRARTRRRILCSLILSPLLFGLVLW